MLEDFEPSRRLVSSSHIVNGIEAVQRNQQLQSDLILLDTGLPDLHGFEAAQQIRKLAPNSKILFLSLHSPSVARAIACDPSEEQELKSADM